MLVSRNGSHSLWIHLLQDHPPLRKDSIVTDTARETESIVIETEMAIIGTLVTVTTKKTTEMATEVLVAAVVGTRVHLFPAPHLVTTATLEGLGVVDVTNTIETGRETMIAETEMDIVVEGGALIAIAITRLLATYTTPRENTQRGEGGTVVETMAIAERREVDMVAIEVVGGVVDVVTEAGTGDSLSLEVSILCT